MLVRLLEPWPLKLIFDHVLLEVPLPRALSFLDGWAGGDRVLLLAMLVVSIVLVALLSGLLYYQQNVRAARLGQEVAAEPSFRTSGCCATRSSSCRSSLPKTRC
jgi:hypothetical protein